ncbi:MULTISPECIES: hypothetical protein [Photorhabdus]|uniref:Photorhabdus luminescens subsp. laumondii TTO1 complete genome segment 10/17 n=1 Tax=Photorhabdus laumondii subsp. laumondii (strain DSM 15139 / CIP 105565 / TT01) TaxID=243265 RepID=Q7N304_PHOLL|nr:MULTISPECIES: hypothetical protein [Photorhabdus]CAE15293.1 unnamed protein product [Photorhabdus laumondii subsp. laumondii TTO1]
MDSFDYHVNVLMPANFFRDDEKWIREMLLQLDPSTRGKITVRYSEVYEAAWDEEPVSYRKDNIARRHANIRLREFVRKYAAFSQGYVTTPTELLKTGTSQQNQPIPEPLKHRGGFFSGKC